MFQEKHDLECPTEIERAQQTSSRQNNMNNGIKPRTIKCNLLRYKDKVKILQKANVKIGFSKFQSPDIFSVLHLKIRSLRKNFEDFKELYKTLNLKFSIVCFSETWADDNKLENDYLIQLPGYNVLHQIGKSRRGGGINISVHESLSLKRRKDLGINPEAVESLSIEILNEICKNVILNTISRPPNGDIESLSIEILNKKCKNIILDTICRSPNGDIETRENYFKNLFAKNDTVNKHILLAGDFNLNVLDFKNNRKVQNFINLVLLWYDTNHKQTHTGNGKDGKCHRPYHN